VSLSSTKWLLHSVRLAVLILLGVGLGSLFLDGESRWSLTYFDFLQEKTKISSQNHVALVVVDQNSLTQFYEKKGLVHPLPREVYGAVAHVAAHFSATALFYDILFTEPSVYGVEDDLNFVNFLKASKVPIVLPDQGQEQTIKRPIEALEKAAQSLASVNSENDADGVYRRSLAGNSVANVVSDLLQQPMSSRMPRYMHYYSEKAFPHKNLYEVISAYDDLVDGKSVSGDFNEMRGKVWVVGFAAPGLNDLKPTPIDPRAPGFIVPATGIANNLSGHGLHRVQTAAGALICFLSAVLSLCAVRLNRLRSWSFAFFLVSAALVPLLISSFFWMESVWLSPLPLMVAGGVVGGCELFWVYRRVWRDQIRMADMIRHSMSSDMVDLVRSGNVKISRFGETRPVTVLFSDLVGFTELSEKISPEDLVRVLNGYFDEVVNLVTTGHGYVDKFIGDAVMAFWGAPIEQKDHAALAYQTAVNFHKAAERYNEKLERFFPHMNRLSTRVGLHSGPAVVGNIGASHRHNYTAIGDTVNIASRLESLCKYYGVQLIASDAAVLAAGMAGRRELIELDHVIVKGRSSPLRIYTYVPLKELAGTEDFVRGLELYYRGDWVGALKLLETCDFAPSRVIANRCRSCLTEGCPVELNDGVWSLETK
jgi:adenylate cyclase